MTKSEKIKAYNGLNRGYNITGIKKMTSEQIEGYRQWGKSDIYEMYKKPSQAKVDSWNKILRDYSPEEIVSVQGSDHAYSVLLIAGNGDTLHITKGNNYLVEVQ